jgi:hypothetical protein
MTPDPRSDDARGPVVTSWTDTSGRWTLVSTPRRAPEVTTVPSPQRVPNVALLLAAGRGGAG